MILEQEFELPLPPDQAWPLFKDVPLLVGCLPGASLLDATDPAALSLLFTVKLGPMSANFAGTGAVKFDDTAQAGRFSGSAVDKRSQSRVKGEARFGLSATEVGTQVAVTVDYALTGPLAQFSRGAILREVANGLTHQFAQNLRTRVAAMASTTNKPAIVAPPAELEAPSAPMMQAPADAADAALAHAHPAPAHPATQATPKPAVSDTPGIDTAKPSPSHNTPASPAALNLGTLLGGALRRWLGSVVARVTGRPGPDQ